MGKIKAKMDVIRANQRKTIDSVEYKPKHHYQGNYFNFFLQFFCLFYLN